MGVTPPKTKNTLLLDAIEGRPTPRTPVWAMRQAGRWDPEFLKLRGGRDFYSFSDDAHLAATASLCPRRFGVDAIILFYDITTLAASMGQKFHLEPNHGPRPERPIRTIADVEGLAESPDKSTFRPVLETLRIVRRELDDELPVLVFAGAPFTLGSYQIGVGKKVDEVRGFAAAQPQVWRALMDRTAKATVGFLRSLLEAGATAYQLFDSWAGSLNDDEYAGWAQAYHQRIFSEVGGNSIIFVKDSPDVDRLAMSGAKVLSLSKHHDIADAQRRHPQLCVQGNVDHELLVTGTPDDVKAATLECLDAGTGSRHILNLDHGMERTAKVENFQAFIDAARNWRPPKFESRL
jgi:uroporphyrinogen decarboxylase